MRLDIGADCFTWIKTGGAKRDNFFFKPHFHTIKRLLLMQGFLMLKIIETGIGFQKFKQRINRLAGSGYRAVDPLFRKQEGALDTVPLAQGEQLALQFRIVW